MVRFLATLYRSDRRIKNCFTCWQMQGTEIMVIYFTMNGSTQRCKVKKTRTNLSKRNKQRKSQPDLITTFLHTWHHKPSLNLACFSIMTLGRSKKNKDWQILTMLISLVLKSFIQKLFITKSSEFRLFLVNGQTSKQYNRIDKHLLLINCKIISSDATRSLFQKLRWPRDKKHI